MQNLKEGKSALGRDVLDALGSIRIDIRRAMPGRDLRNDRYETESCDGDDFKDGSYNDDDGKFSGDGDEKEEEDEDGFGGCYSRDDSEGAVYDDDDEDYEQDEEDQDENVEDEDDDDDECESEEEPSDDDIPMTVGEEDKKMLPHVTQFVLCFHAFPSYALHHADTHGRFRSILKLKKKPLKKLSPPSTPALSFSSSSTQSSSSPSTLNSTPPMRSSLYRPTRFAKKAPATAIPSGTVECYYKDHQEPWKIMTLRNGPKELLKAHGIITGESNLDPEVAKSQIG